MDVPIFHYSQTVYKNPNFNVDFECKMYYDQPRVIHEFRLKQSFQFTQTHQI